MHSILNSFFMNERKCFCFSGFLLRLCLSTEICFSASPLFHGRWHLKDLLGSRAIKLLSLSFSTPYSMVSRKAMYSMEQVTLLSPLVCWNVVTLVFFSIAVQHIGLVIRTVVFLVTVWPLAKHGVDSTFYSLNVPLAGNILDNTKWSAIPPTLCF